MKKLIVLGLIFWSAAPTYVQAFASTESPLNSDFEITVVNTLTEKEEPIIRDEMKSARKLFSKQCGIKLRFILKSDSDIPKEGQLLSCVNPLREKAYPPFTVFIGKDYIPFSPAFVVGFVITERNELFRSPLAEFAQPLMNTAWMNLPSLISDRDARSEMGLELRTNPIAHEISHLLGLEHDNTPGNLMGGGRSEETGSQLSLNQCDILETNIRKSYAR